MSSCSPEMVLKRSNSPRGTTTLPLLIDLRNLCLHSSTYLSVFCLSTLLFDWSLLRISQWLLLVINMSSSSLFIIKVMNVLGYSVFYPCTHGLPALVLYILSGIWCKYVLMLPVKILLYLAVLFQLILRLLFRLHATPTQGLLILPVQ